MSKPADYDLYTQIQIETDYELPKRRIQEAIEWLLHTHEVPTGTGMSIVTVTDDEMRRLNRQYRAIDAPTDVLSFAAGDSALPDGEERYLGDLVLALPYIQRQAKAENHEVDDELILAVVHGTLHLLGYDHDTPDNQAAMWRVQADALEALAIEIVVPLFEFGDNERDSEPD
jgi:probable rRNA maturation factor